MVRNWLRGTRVLNWKLRYLFQVATKHAISTRWLASPNRGHVATFLMIFGARSMNILFIVKVKDSCAALEMVI